MYLSSTPMTLLIWFVYGVKNYPIRLSGEGWCARKVLGGVWPKGGGVYGVVTNIYFPISPVIVPKHQPRQTPN